MDQTAAAINTVNQSRLNNRSESGKTQAEGQAKRQQKERIKLNEETLTNKEKGLKRLYEESLKLNVKGNPEDDLKRLMNLYKEWHFQLAPKFEFSYFIQKCQILGQKAPIRAFMSRIRNVHRGELTWADLEKQADTFSDQETEQRDEVPLEIEGESSWNQLQDSLEDTRKRKHSMDLEEDFKMARIAEEDFN